MAKTGRKIGERSRTALLLIRDSAFQITRDALAVEIGRLVPPAIAHRKAVEHREKDRMRRTTRSRTGKTFGPRSIPDPETIRSGRNDIARNTIRSIVVSQRVVQTPDHRFAPGPKWSDDLVETGILPPYDEAPP